MSYDLCEESLQTALMAIDELSESVSRGDYSVLDRGHDFAVVLQYESYNNDQSSFGSLTTGQNIRTQNTWGIKIVLYVKHIIDSKLNSDVIRLRQTIIDTVTSNPSLGNKTTCLLAMIESGNAQHVGPNAPTRGPYPVSQFGNVRYYTESLRCMVKEVNDVVAV